MNYNKVRTRSVILSFERRKNNNKNYKQKHILFFYICLHNHISQCSLFFSCRFELLPLVFFFLTCKIPISICFRAGLIARKISPFILVVPCILTDSFARYRAFGLSAISLSEISINHPDVFWPPQILMSNCLLIFLRVPYT